MSKELTERDYLAYMEVVRDNIRRTEHMQSMLETNRHILKMGFHEWKRWMQGGTRPQDIPEPDRPIHICNNEELQTKILADQLRMKSKHFKT